MSISLRDSQLDAVNRMRNGCILCGDVGSGKSRTSLAYYFTQQGGKLKPYSPMKNPKDLYIITTARKRDELEWEGELVPFLLSTDVKKNALNGNAIFVDSWNNIGKYEKVEGAFFIFDEQRVVGSGAWVKSFLKIAKVNDWILLSATPGDKWEDYIPVFIANGFYRTKTEFTREHLVYARYSKFPKVERYLNTGRLLRLRNQVLVEMEVTRHTVRHHEDIYVKYDVDKYKYIMKNRWNIYENKPLKNAAELCYILRRVVNTDESRATALLEILETHPKAIIFYNFDYELELLKGLCYAEGTIVAEWNGHKHESIPTEDRWVYFVQYTAGAEGWNCVTTDTIIFFSQNYSYKIIHQSAGRIDRMNTPFTDLYYYHLKSRAGIDLAIGKALRDKKRFNESRWAKKFDEGKEKV